MAKKAKSTKKFEKSKLKDTLERRKDFAKVKQRQKQKDKRKRSASKTQDDDGDDDSERPTAEVEIMDRDDFFQDSMPLPSIISGASSKKRKRDKAEEDGAEVSSNEGSLAASDEDDEDHRGQLEGLAQKDPEFYKYLQENDAELLDFDDEDHQDNDDALSDREERPAKKQKIPGEPEIVVVTQAMVTKWKSSVVEQHSVRALRQLIFAFKASAHGDDEDTKGTEVLRYLALMSTMRSW